MLTSGGEREREKRERERERERGERESRERGGVVVSPLSIVIMLIPPVCQITLVLWYDNNQVMLCESVALKRKT